MLEAWISAIVCLNGLPSTSSSTFRYLISLQADELPFRSVLASWRDCPRRRCGAIRCGFRTRLVVLPALAGGDAEDGVVLLFCAVLASAFFPRRPMRMTLLNMVEALF